MVADLIILSLFVINGLIHLSNEAKENARIFSVKALTKLLVIPLIIIYYVMITAQINYVVLFGLVMGWFGDLFLLKKEDKKLFVFGLVSFMLGHILFVVAFMLSVDFNSAYNLSLIILVLLYSAFLIVMISKIKNSLGKFLVPVVVYAFILVLMSVSAFMVAKSPNPSFRGNGWVLFAGSLLFLISDSNLAYCKFVKKYSRHNVLTMATYMTAQLLIAYGYIV